VVTFTEALNAGNPVQLLVIQQPSKTAQATVPLGTQPKVQVADQFGNAVALAGLQVGASYQFDCTRSGCLRATPVGGGRASLNRSGAGTTLRAGNATTRPLSRQIASSTRISAATTALRPLTASIAVEQGLAGTTTVTTDANGTASFSDLTLNLSVGFWQLIFFDERESLTLGISDDIALAAGPVDAIVQLPPDSGQSVFAWSGDTTYFSLAGDVIYPKVQVIDAVGNGVPGVAVDWASSDESSFADGSKKVTTKTDADGFATPGGWVMPLSSNVSTFAIQASTSVSGGKSVQTTLYAMFQPPIGRVVPVIPSSRPR
jgi:hypothetical protein